MLVDIPTLIKPLHKENPCGADMMYSNLYDEIKQARSQDEYMPQGVWETDKKEADWARVYQLSLHVLEKHSKDLQASLWLCEALFFRHSLEGLHQGLELIFQLLKRYWKDLYPKTATPSERSYLLEWFSKKQSEHLLILAICKPKTAGLDPYNLFHYIQAQYNSHTQKISRSASKSEPSSIKEIIFKSVQSTPQSFYDTLIHNTEKIQDTLARIETLFQGEDSQPRTYFFSELTNQLTALKETAETLKKQAKPASSATQMLQAVKRKLQSAPSPETESKEEAPLLKGATVKIETIQSREDAYELLKKVSLFLEMTDRHSPVPYLLKRLYTWKDKSFLEITGEFSNPTQASSLINEFCNAHTPEKKETR